MKLFSLLVLLTLVSCHHSAPKVEWAYPPCPISGVLKEVDTNGNFQCRVKKWTHVQDPQEKHLYKVLSPGPDCWQDVPEHKCDCYVSRGVENNQGIFEYLFCASR